jgi:hypothetical protein
LINLESVSAKSCKKRRISAPFGHVLVTR